MVLRFHTRQRRSLFLPHRRDISIPIHRLGLFGFGESGGPNRASSFERGGLSEIAPRPARCRARPGRVEESASSPCASPSRGGGAEPSQRISPARRKSDDGSAEGDGPTLPFEVKWNRRPMNGVLTLTRKNLRHRSVRALRSTGSARGSGSPRRGARWRYQERSLPSGPAAAGASREHALERL